MRSAQRGKRTSAVEIGNISKHGFWLLVGDREMFLPFTKFPWFREVPIGKLLNVVLLHPQHLYWPDLDIDLAVQSIEQPEKYPLVSRWRPKTPLQPTGVARRRSKGERARSRARS
ncbi:MAG: DUF2442 domain-containing protein [Candidatus Eisenbacteria bacterium]|nr:DUF2442 domain-containing protein [Candidatus Eisenbacteria bacterium]